LKIGYMERTKVKVRTKYTLNTQSFLTLLIQMSIIKSDPIHKSKGFNVFSEEDKNKANGLMGPNEPDKQNERHPNDISLCTDVPV
jgi:hypothetical protein